MCSNGTTYFIAAQLRERERRRWKNGWGGKSERRGGDKEGIRREKKEGRNTGNWGRAGNEEAHGRGTVRKDGKERPTQRDCESEQKERPLHQSPRWEREAPRLPWASPRNGGHPTILLSVILHPSPEDRESFSTGHGSRPYLCFPNRLLRAPARHVFMNSKNVCGAHGERMRS